MREFDRCIDDIGILRRDGEAYLPHVLLGQSPGELEPGLAAVVGLVDSGLGPAVYQGCNVAVSLVGRSIENVGVTRVHCDVVDAGVPAGGQDLRPVDHCG